MKYPTLGLDPADYVENFDQWEEVKEQQLGHLHSCAVYTQIGHTVSWMEDRGLPTGTVQICMSPNQLRKFFRTRDGVAKAERLGCGAFACAWGTGPDEVVKITTDPDDVDALQRAQGLEHVVKLRDVREIVDAATDESGEKVPAYALQLERLEPPDEVMAEVIDGFPTGRIREDFLAHYGDYFAAAEDADPDYKLADATKMAFTDACDSIGDDDPDGACQTFAREVMNTVEQLGKRGVNWSDLHSGNVGVKDGVWKALDIGAVGAQFHPDVKTLRGGPAKITGSFCERTVAPRGRFDKRSFRWTERSGNWILIGCPKGKWDESTNSCRVGTRAHKVLSKSDGSRCRRGRKIKKG